MSGGDCGDSKASLVVTYTKDVRKKKGKKWFDGTLEIAQNSRHGALYDDQNGDSTNTGTGRSPLAYIECVPPDVCLRRGGGEAFLMRENYDQGREYLVQVDDMELSDDDGVRSDLVTDENTVATGRLVNARIVAEAMQDCCPVDLDGGLTVPRQSISAEDDPQHNSKSSIYEGCMVKKRRTTQELLDVLGIGVCTVDRKCSESSDLVQASHVNDPPPSHGWDTSIEKVLKNNNGKDSHSVPKEVRATSKSPTFSGVSCPTVEQCRNPVRHIFVPTRFDAVRDYLEVMETAILEEAFLRLIDSTMARFYGALSIFSDCPSISLTQVEDACQRAKIRGYHGACQLKIYSNTKNKYDSGEKKRESVFISLGSNKVKASEYHKSDLWVLSNDPAFGRSKVKKGSTWTCVVKSLWHGPNKDGKFEVAFVSKKPAYMGRACKVFALQGPEVSIEMDLADLFVSTSSLDAPILPQLLHRVHESKQCRNDQMSSEMPEFREVSQAFGLNVHQLEALRHVATWHIDSSMNPICLVHGPFGTGKSQLLVSILHLILKLRETNGALSNARVLVCSHTNVAVDRVCIGLMESSVETFLRVGPVRKIHHSLLPYTLHASDSKSHANALTELKDMAKKATGDVLEKLKAEISAVERGADKKRKKLLKTCPIVGVTCVSTALEVLQDQTFDVLLLDEASQMTEPLSLAPMIRSKCKYVIAAGDPHQLPPVVCTPEKVEGENLNGLIRPLFVRLACLGHIPHLLKTQYRCHPHISSISNKFFYDSKLEDGVSMEDRSSLIPSISSSVAVVDVPFGHESYSQRSIYNDIEARTVGNIVKSLVEQGICLNDIGIIAFYKAHVDCLKSHVRGVLTDPNVDALQVATVDSFQGAEKNVIILSSATTRPSTFATDACRLNVALTRAKRHLLLVGNVHILSKCMPVFEYILSRAKAQGGYFLGGLPRHTSTTL